MDVHAICVHLGLAEAHRQQQLELLCEIVRSEVPEDAPLIVAGDFNDWRRRAHDMLWRDAGLKEVFVTAYGESAKTFPARFPLLSLDRIYVRNASVHLPVVLPRRPWSHLSDHAPLAAEIHLYEDAMNARWIEGNDIRLLENGEEFFPRVFACIANAQQEVVAGNLHPVRGQGRAAAARGAGRGGAARRAGGRDHRRLRLARPVGALPRPRWPKPACASMCSTPASGCWAGA